MTRLINLGFAMLLVLAACSSSGGGADGSSAGDAPASVSGAASEAARASDETKTTESVNPDDPLGFGEAQNTATVTVGDTTYEFENLYCVTIGGALGASSVGGDPTVDISLPPEGWETSGEDWSPPSVRVQGDDPYFDYMAGGDVAMADDRLAGRSQVDSFSSDGYHATGEATFIDQQAFMLDATTEGMTGTFEVTCPK